MKILVTGAAGFIGSCLSRTLIKDGFTIVGVDNLNDYYDIYLKYDRLNDLGIHISEKDDVSKEILSNKYTNFSFMKLDLTKKKKLDKLFSIHKFTHVCHLAAQAGVRYSLTNPQAYIDSNIQGFINILEACRNKNIEHLVYASSSSVYGMNENYPFSVHDNVDHPVSLYAASKKSNELMAHCYSHLYDLPTTGLRFFTVYGPWGRPDMALFLFTKAILTGKKIEVYNYGKMRRDFTYIDDIVEGMKRVIFKKAAPNESWSGANPDPGSSSAPYRLYNIGSNRPVLLMDFIKAIEKELGIKAKMKLLPMQPGDVASSHADVSDLIKNMDYFPSTPIETGIRNFIEWYKYYYKIK